MKNKTTPAPAVTPHRHTAEEFAKMYRALCKETGFQIAFYPQWRQSQDTGDYRLVIVSQVVPVKAAGE
jgi:hypothetical protein